MQLNWLDLYLKLRKRMAPQICGCGTLRRFSDHQDVARHPSAVDLADYMLASGRRLAETIGLATSRSSFRARLKPPMSMIGRLVRELRGLAEDDIKIVEEATT
jgi:hypothetical protein